MLHGRCSALRRLLLLLPAAVRAFTPGDPVPMMRRTQHSGQRTDWHEVPFRVAPRFLTDATVALEALPSNVPASEPFKISLALHGLRYVTSWITLSDGDGRFLSSLELQLTASGDTLSAVHWEAEYTEGEVPPDRIILHTVWDEALEHNFSLALRCLLLLGAALTCYILYSTCMRHEGALAKLFFEEEEEDREREEEDHRRLKRQALQQHRPGGVPRDPYYVHEVRDSRSRRGGNKAD